MYINYLHTDDSLVTGTALRQANIGAAVEFSGRASAGFAGG